MLDTQEQWWHEVGRTMAGVFSLERVGVFRFFFFFVVVAGLVLRTVSAGSLTRRCGRGESAIRGRAVGFRVGHGEGHWAGHWGRWRQQEGAWHFALAAPVWLQTTQIGSGGRHATIRRHGMNRGRSSGGQVQKNIHDGGEGGGDGGRRERRWWETTTKGMIYVDGIFLWRCEK